MAGQAEVMLLAAVIELIVVELLVSVSVDLTTCEDLLLFVVLIGLVGQLLLLFCLFDFVWAGFWQAFCSDRCDLLLLIGDVILLLLLVVDVEFLTIATADAWLLPISGRFKAGARIIKLLSLLNNKRDLLFFQKKEEE